MPWELSGNAGTNPANDVLGTTDNQPLAIRTNTSEKVRVMPDGNVGIGTATPSQKLTLGSGNVLLPNGNGGNDGNLYFGGITDAGQTGLRLFGGLVNNAIPAGFIDVRTTDPNDGLRIRVDTAAGGTERMRVTASGNVGIGTSNPITGVPGGRALHIHNPTGASALRLGDGSAYGRQWEWQSTVVGDVGAMNLTNYYVPPPPGPVATPGPTGSGSWPLPAGSGASVSTIEPVTGYPILTALANGAVGIGTTKPGSKLEVQGQLRTTGPLVFVDPNGMPYPDNWIGVATNIEDTTKWLHIGGITDGGVRRLTLWADRTFIQGNVSIGTTTPLHSLHVDGTAIFSGGQSPGLLLAGGTWNSVNRDVPYPAVPIGGAAPGAAPAPGELVLGGVRTSIRGFDGGLPSGPAPPIDGVGGPLAQVGLRAGQHWIRTNGNEDERWIGFERRVVRLGSPNGPRLLQRRLLAPVPWSGPSFSETSDARLKTNVRQVEGALDKLERIRGVAFEWAETQSPYALGGVPGQPGLGVVAQEVEEVFPEVVSTYARPDQEDTAQKDTAQKDTAQEYTDQEGFKAVDYSGLTSVLIEAVKELKAQNEALRSRIEALEGAQE